MKLVFEPGEKERIQEEYEKSQHRFFYDDEPEHIYSISFRVTNPAIAQYILPMLLHGKLPDFDLGISPTSLNFRDVQNADEVKQRLYQAIDEIIT